MQISQSPSLLLLAGAIGTIPIAFGINNVLRPAHGLSFFNGLTPPTTPHEKALVEGLMILQGARNLFWGGMMWATAYYGNRQALGWSLIAGSLVAFADGVVCKSVSGGGEWDHWGYAPFLTVLGTLLLGMFDRR